MNLNNYCLQIHTFVLGVISLVFTCLSVQAQINYPYHITDALGQTITIERPLQRIICLNRQTCELMVVLGAADKIIATGDATVRNNPYLGLENLPQMGATGSENIEAIIALNPDAVFAYSRRSPYIDAQLSGSGIKVIRIDNNRPVSQDQELLLLGKLLQQPDRAAALLAWKKQLRQLAIERSTQIPATQRLRVAAFSLRSLYHQGSFNLFPVFTATGSEGPGESYSAILAGGLDAFPMMQQASTESQLTLLLNPESLLQQNPQVITFHGSIYGGYDGPDGLAIQAMFNHIKQHTPLNLTAAAQHQRIYFFHTDLTGGNKREIGVLQLIKYLYPEVMQDIEPIRYLQDYFNHSIGQPYQGVWFYADGEQ